MLHKKRPRPRTPVSSCICSIRSHCKAPRAIEQDGKTWGNIETEIGGEPRSPRSREVAKRNRIHASPSLSTFPRHKSMELRRNCQLPKYSPAFSWMHRFSLPSTDHYPSSASSPRPAPHSLGEQGSIRSQRRKLSSCEEPAVLVF